MRSFFAKLKQWFTYHIVRGSPKALPVMPSEPGEDRPDASAKGEKLLYYPVASRIPSVQMPIRGTYQKGYPVGAIIHFTAGRSLKGDQDAVNTVIYGKEQGYAYMCISNDGSVYQAHPLNQWGNHAGTSHWPGLGGDVSRYLVGIEICCAGDVKPLPENKFKSWFGEIYNASQVRRVESDHGCPAGYYHKYTPEQETALVNLLLWLKSNNPEVFDFDYVLGHHEVSGEKGIGYWRKSDPGGSLSIPMVKLREHLKQEYLKKTLEL